MKFKFLKLADILWKMVFKFSVEIRLIQWISHVRPGSVKFSSVPQSYPTLCNPINCSRLGLPVHHQLQEPTQTHVHRVGDAIQPSHLLSSPFLTYSLNIERLLLSHERLRDSWHPEERNSIQGQWWGLITQSFCVIQFYWSIKETNFLT